MLPSHWPSWILIPIALGLTLLTVLLGLVLEPAVQAVTPLAEPTPLVASFPARLPYAAPVSGGCVECHTNETALQNAGADEAALEALLLDPASPMTLHGRLGCVTCHAGIGTTQNVDAAHQDLVVDPGHPDQATTYCLPCHHDLPSQYPEDSLQAPHDRILTGIRADEDVCSCSNCHGAAAHGVDPVTNHETLASATDTCVDCHENEGVAEEALFCSGCHVSPHAERNECQTCHVSTNTWSTVSYGSHPTELEGTHASVECYECHVEPHFVHVAGYDCADCHTKSHELGGDDCARCHGSSVGWDEIDEQGLNHQAIWEDYEDHLAHEDVACSGCHLEGYDTSLSTECTTCHAEEPGLEQEQEQEP